MPPLAVLLGSFLFMVLAGVPVAFALGLASMLVLTMLGIPLTSVINQMYTSINSFPLLAVPFFLLAGALMNDGGVTDRLVKLSRSLVGHIPGGLGHVNVLVSMLFAGLSGSAAADTAGVGAMLIPAMKKAGYDTDYAVAITAASSTMGVIIPPSIMMVIYGAVGNVSIGALFLAGVIPGLLIGFGQMAVTYYLAIKRGYPAGQRAGAREMLVALWRALLPLGMPLLIIGGITGGFFTATEASAVAVVYGLVLMVVIYRSLPVAKLPKIFGDAVVFFSLAIFAVATAGIFGWLISYLNAPQAIAGLIENVTTHPLGIAALIVALLLVVGTFLSPITAIIIFLPIIQGLGEVAGFHPVHLGVVVVLTLSLGMITPPYGICLLIASEIGGIPAPRAFRATFGLVAMALGVITFAVLFPDAMLFLPRLIMPQFVN